MSAPIGIMGGTFDPVHFGHLRLAQEAAEILGLERVRWVPAGQPWHRGAPLAPAMHRLEMVRLAIGKNTLFELDDAEIRQTAPGYTVETLERLRNDFGAEWRKRAGTPDVLRERPGGNVVTYGTTALDISASAIRAHFAQARSPRYLLPSAVHDYIETHGLYTKEGSAGKTVPQLLAAEAERIERAVPRGAMRVALDERGRELTTAQLARWLEARRQDGRDMTLLIGGADGLAPAVTRGAELVLRLSAMTLPHGLARVMLAEQLYRAASILHNHPYHRE